MSDHPYTVTHGSYVPLPMPDAYSDIQPFNLGIDPDRLILPTQLLEYIKELLGTISPYSASEANELTLDCAHTLLGMAASELRRLRGSGKKESPS